MIGTDQSVKIGIAVYNSEGQCQQFGPLDVFLGWNVAQILKSLPAKTPGKWQQCWRCNDKGERINDHWPFEFTGIQYVWNSGENKWELQGVDPDGVLRVLLL